MGEHQSGSDNAPDGVSVGNNGHRQDGHPLAQFKTLRRVPQAVRWVVPGVIEQGVVTIAGARGVGKTTALVPLALSAAGLHEHGYPLAPHPDRWRHVIYAVEQVEQAERILAGVVECSGMGITWEQVEERFHLVEAIRLNVDAVVQVAGLYREKFVRIVDGVEILPLVVFDTQNASFDMGNENDNAEAGRIMAALKQRFEHLPIWIICHIAKASGGKADESLSARGASAFESDAIQNCYLVHDDTDKQRYLSIGKHRAEPRFGKNLLIESGEQTTAGYNEWGEEETVHLRWSIVRPMKQPREKTRQDAQEAGKRDRQRAMRESITNAVEAAWQSGDPLSKNGVREIVKGFRASDVLVEADELLAEGWLCEIEVPSSQRRARSKTRFLVKLDELERDEHRRSGVLPDSKLVIPDSWKKAPNPLVPEVDADSAGNDDATTGL
jgi:RecA-family ATPase